MRLIAAGSLMLALCSCSMVGQQASSEPGYLVFFTERSAALEAPARGVIARAAAAARAMPDAPVTVIGWTDSAGGQQADVVLSRQRAQAVADALVADGVASSRLSRQGLGQTHDDPGVESRRVQIKIGS